MAGHPAAPNGSTTIATPPDVQLWMLVDDQGNTFPPFNCGYYTSTTLDKLVGTTTWGDGTTHQRVLQSSGCKLFALSSYLGGAGVRVPSYDPSTKTFSAQTPPVDMRTDTSWKTPTVTGSPRQFLHYLWDWIMYVKPTITTRDAASQDLTTKILLPDGPGAISYDQPLCDAVNQMLITSRATADTESCPPPRTLTFAATVTGPWKGGTDIPDLTSWVCDASKTAILGIGDTQSHHVVLVVGVAKYKTSTYYVITDSGFGPMDPSPLLPIQTTYAWSTVVKHCVSTSRNFSNIYWYKKVEGLDFMHVVQSNQAAPAAPQSAPVQAPGNDAPAG